MVGLNRANAETEWLLDLLDQAYNRQAWHGPNLRGSIRGLTAAQAIWRPHERRHNIAEIVLHLAYWKYTVRRRLAGQRRGSFLRKGSNWFHVSDDLAEASWRECVVLLDDEHRALRSAVVDLPRDRLREVPERGTHDLGTLIRGVAAHDLYHTGQIQLLKRLQTDLGDEF